ncbi:hypothetical protein MY10362_009889 [Beauveria mimosiformis]
MKPSWPRYEPLSLRATADDGCGGSSSTPEKRLSCEDDSSASLLQGSDNLPAQASPQPSSSSLVRRLGLYLSLALALLAAANVALLLATLSMYRDNHPLKVQVANPTIPQTYHRAWPDRIVRVSRKLKKAVWGQSVQVYVTVEDSTIMRFPLPPGSGIGHACALSWRAPPELSGRAKDLTTKGDVSEIQVWQLIAPSTTTISAATSPSTMDELDYDTLSYSTLPVRGELLGVLNLSEKPNNTTAEFACPSGTESLVVEMRCQRVACHVSFMQIDLKPSFGFELLSRKS